MTISIVVATDRAGQIANQTSLAKIANFTKKIAIKIAIRTNLAIVKIATVALIPGIILINIGMKIANFAKMVAISKIAKIATIIGIMIATQIARIAIMTKEIVVDLGDVIENRQFRKDGDFAPCKKRSNFFHKQTAEFE